MPYLIGWSMGIWGPRSPRWLLLLGIVVGLWYVVIMVMVLGRPYGALSPWPGIALGGIGMLTILGSIYRLRKPGVSLRPDFAVDF